MPLELTRRTPVTIPVDQWSLRWQLQGHLGENKVSVYVFFFFFEIIIAKVKGQ